MSKLKVVCLVISMAILSSFFLTIFPPNAQSEPINSGNTRAAKGDTVWVVLYNVKPEKSEQFEKFWKEVLLKGFEDLDDSNQSKQAMKQCRFLEPIKPNSDGTLTYIWLMDPVLSSVRYEMRTLLRQIYPEEKVEKYFSMWEDSFIPPFEWHVKIQSEI